jgi:hypothetical protein
MKTANYAVEIEFLFKYAGQTAWWRTYIYVILGLLLNF